MKTLLIVEDEKMIRQGIRAMVQRSGVPVEVILECNNGERALEIIKEQKIDVMFTDIRMPKMDGIELVSQMQSCEHVPLTVAISGFDDFSYAVEMLRNGVREYILKPIDREKVVEVLQKLDNEITNSKERIQTDQQIGQQQMKQLMLGNELDESEMEVVERKYSEYFFKGQYRVCCSWIQKRRPVEEGKAIFIPKIGDMDVYIVPVENADALLEDELNSEYVGVSDIHCGIRQLKKAYEEAAEMRKLAFMRVRENMVFGEEQETVLEKLNEDSQRVLSHEANKQRVQQIGTDHTEELMRNIKQIFTVAKGGYVTAKQFEDCIHGFFAEIEKTYKNILNPEDELWDTCNRIWNAECIDIYEEIFDRFVIGLHEQINKQFDLNKNTQKISQAIEYIEQHYADDLNMAVVSNYISMNYSLFSYSFKQYTGSNFVNYLKDIRVREAKKLLAETDMKIIEISQKVGYDNEKHFMKIFKNTCGVTPTEYRKNMRC